MSAGGFNLATALKSTEDVPVDDELIQQARAADRLATQAENEEDETRRTNTFRGAAILFRQIGETLHRRSANPMFGHMCMICFMRAAVCFEYCREWHSAAVVWIGALEFMSPGMKMQCFHEIVDNFVKCSQHESAAKYRRLAASHIANETVENGDTVTRARHIIELLVPNIVQPELVPWSDAVGMDAYMIAAQLLLNPELRGEVDLAQFEKLRPQLREHEMYRDIVEALE